MQLTYAKSYALKINDKFETTKFQIVYSSLFLVFKYLIAYSNLTSYNRK